MSEHMPCHLAVSIDAEGQQRLVIDAKDYWANGLFLSDGKFDPEDARRLAAAWNACERMPTEDIEELAACQGVMTLTVYADDILSELNAARALLREVLEAGFSVMPIDFSRNPSSLESRVLAHLDACDKPGEPT